MKSGYCSPNSLQWIKGVRRNFFIDTRCVEKHLPCNHIEILARTLYLPLRLISGASIKHSLPSRLSACQCVCLDDSASAFVCVRWLVSASIYLQTDRHYYQVNEGMTCRFEFRPQLMNLIQILLSHFYLGIVVIGWNVSFLIFAHYVFLCMCFQLRKQL